MLDFGNIQFVRAANAARDFPRDGQPQVCFAGRSNVGKSSLLNVLVGRRNIARTSKTPGRTREIIFFHVPDRLYLVDLPGYGYAKVPHKMREEWGRLIDSYLTDNAALRLMVLLLDVRHDPTQDDFDLIDWLESCAVPYVLVLTKCDKVSGNGYARQAKRIRELIAAQRAENETATNTEKVRTIRFSTKTGQGRRELIGAILDAVDVRKSRSESSE